jgi:PhoPQ-activated pathogenicity-related protein
MSNLLYTTTTCCTRAHPISTQQVPPNQVIFLDNNNNNDNDDEQHDHDIAAAHEIFFQQQQQRPIPILHPLVHNLQRIFAGETISTARDFVDLWLFPGLVLICIHATRGAAGCLRLGDCI